TLVPALLGFAGPRLGRSNRFLSWRPRRRPAGTETMSVRWARRVTRRPAGVLVVGLALVGVLALPAMHLKLGPPDDGSKPKNTTERKAYDLLTQGFGPGFNGPLTVVVDAPEVDPADRAALASGVADGLEGFPGVAAVSQPLQNEAGDLTILLVTP